MTTTTAAASPGPVDPVGPELAGLLRSLKLSGLKHTLPERLSLARTRQISHAQFLELLLADEVSRRDARSAERRSVNARIILPGQSVRRRRLSDRRFSDTHRTGRSPTGGRRATADRRRPPSHLQTHHPGHLILT